MAGGAPPGERLGHFFRGIGVPVLEGYGPTKTTAALSVNLPDDIWIGTVGKPLPGVTVGVADDGELCFKGGQVMLGYWKNDEATAAAIDSDGWFHTGDLGDFDADGFIKITGRKKESPGHRWRQERCPCSHRGPDPPAPAGQPVHGRRRREALHRGADHHRSRDHRRLGRQHGKSTVMSALATDKDLIAEIQIAIDDANTTVSKAEAIKKFSTLENDWTQENGELSLKLSLRRHIVMKKHEADVEALYLH
ncbi:AMP-binding protein [Streptomyces sp. SID13031]|uniref:AMP-binding protein n=1 Tax=Streptomyces sp. SID13031 TaxID=2706046 RepID=UPI0031BB2945